MLWIALLTAALASDPMGAAVAIPSPLDRVSLTLAVLAANPEVSVAKAALDAARAHTDVAGAWADPMVDLSVAPLSIGGGMLGWNASVSQALPLWGTRDAAKEMAVADSDAAAARLAMMRLDLARMSAMAWADWYVLHSEIALVGHEEDRLKHIADATNARVATGQASSLDALTTQAEAAGLAASLPALEAEQDGVAARINALLHRPLDTPVPAPSDAPPPPAEPPSAPSADATTPKRPEIAEADAMLRAAQAGERMARLDRLPMIGGMVAWDAMQEMPEDRLMGGISVAIPLALRSRAGAVREAEAQVARAEATRTAQDDKVSLEIWTARRTYAGQVATVAAIRTQLLPAARARVDAARTSFGAGMIDVRPLLEAEHAAHYAEMLYVQAQATLEERAAEVEIALGTLPGDPP